MKWLIFGLMTGSVAAVIAMAVEDVVNSTTGRELLPGTVQIELRDSAYAADSAVVAPTVDKCLAAVKSGKKRSWDKVSINGHQYLVDVLRVYNHHGVMVVNVNIDKRTVPPHWWQPREITTLYKALAKISV